MFGRRNSGCAPRTRLFTQADSRKKCEFQWKEQGGYVKMGKERRGQRNLF